MSSAAARKTFIAQNTVAAAVTFIDVKPFVLNGKTTQKLIQASEIDSRDDTEYSIHFRPHRLEGHIWCSA